MRDKVWLVLALGVGLAVARPAAADVWDVETINDNSTATQNELVHGSDQLHDLGFLAGPVADDDFFRISEKAYSSYEVVVDATSGDLKPFTVELVTGGGNVAATPVSSLALSQSLRFANNTGTDVNGNFVHVGGAACTTTCGADDVYRIRAYETTYAIPRFNNTGGQTTVLLIQNPADYSISGTAYFWDEAGNPLFAQVFTAAAKASYRLATSTVVPNLQGSITVVHDGRYGDLSGKVVTLQPSTGFSFDTPMVPRPH